MSKEDRKITRADIMDMDLFGQQRKEMRKGLLPAKKLRRVALGPDATFYFESYDTMWLQVHEMLYIEKGGEEQIEDELSAYNPLIPQGKELVATLMFEIDDEARRKRVLGSLGGVEETVFLQVGPDKIMAEAEEDVDRTTAEGKASSVHFLHFPFTDVQIAAFKDDATDVVLGLEHQGYSHMTRLSPEARKELATDFA
jgi:hypothetical protein